MPTAQEIERRRKISEYQKGHTNTGRFKKGERRSPQTEFKKEQIPWTKINKGKYKLKSYNLTEEGKKQKIINLKVDFSDKGTITKQGYKKKTRNRKQISEHQLVWCAQKENLNYIPKGFIIHHIDGNKLNNHPGNLFLISNSDHTKLHRAMNKALEV